jgi:capsular exopolysaccharide synthesis family protein
LNSESTSWNLTRILGSLRRFWYLIVAFGAIGGAVAFAFSAATTPIYQASSSLYFALNQGGSALDLNQGSAYTQNQMLSFGQLATSSRVLQPVIDKLDLQVTTDELARSISVSIPQSTVILDIQASSTSASESAEIANAVASSLTRVVGEIAPTGADSSPTVNAQIIESATVPTVQALPDKTRDTALGILAGILLGLLEAFTITALDTRIRSVEILGQIVSRPVLGTVSRVREQNGIEVMVATDPIGYSAEEFRRIRASLAYASVSDPLRRLLITSSLPGEGKSTVATNLALIMADQQHRILLIDADLRKPRVHEYLGIEGSVGLTTVFVGDVTFEQAKMSWGSGTLDVLTAGLLPPNPAEVLTSVSMRRFLAEVGSQYDLVIIDSPPVLSVADASLLAPAVDGVVVVVDSVNTRRSQLIRSVKEIENAGGRIVGMILNHTKRSDETKARYYSEDLSLQAVDEI